MTRLDFPRYLQHIRDESARFRAALADCDPAARVPSCPDWDAGDLLWHLGAGVQGFWADIVEQRPEGPSEGRTDPERPASYDEILARFDTEHARLVAALEAADPADPAWTWSTEQTVGFTFRRQAHEALIHRIDAEQTAGLPVGETDRALAADGVDETLAVMFGGSVPWGTFTPLPQHIRVDLTDAATSIWVQLGRFTGTDPDGGTSYDEDDIHVVDDPGTEPDATVVGPAAAVDTWIWKRGDDSEITVSGDPDVCDRFRAIVGQPLN
ncbi:MAG: maleylpyruvate isomerase N-terminal domain-containing protein [Actinomycetota bacterium]|nr:maleylpyruvate isomerase N-terminal domain-containing protein [Actinomycetota bacterium]